MAFCPRNHQNRLVGKKHLLHILFFLVLYQNLLEISKYSLFKGETRKLAVAVTSQKCLFFFLPVMRYQGHEILMFTLPDLQSLRYTSHGEVTLPPLAILVTQSCKFSHQIEDANSSILMTLKIVKIVCSFYQLYLLNFKLYDLQNYINLKISQLLCINQNYNTLNSRPSQK